MKVDYWDEVEKVQKTRDATPEEEARYTKMATDVAANAPIKKWKEEMAALDREGVNRPIENIIDSMDAAQLSRLDPFIKGVHARKKTRRLDRPV